VYLELQWSLLSRALKCVMTHIRCVQKKTHLHVFLYFRGKCLD